VGDISYSNHNIVQFIYFFLWLLITWLASLRKCCQKDLVLSPMSFIVSTPIFKSIIHFNLS
jgi:hypothetical protein